MSEPFAVELVNESKAEAYNDVVRQFPQVDFLQSFEWGEIKRPTGWLPHRLIIRDREGHARAAMTFLEKKVPGLRKTFLYSPRGPVLDYQDEPALTYTIDIMKDLARDRHAMFVKIDPDIPKPQPGIVNKLRHLQFVPGRPRPHWGGVQPVAVCRLDIEGEEDAIFARFRSKTRYNIRLARRRGVVVRAGERTDIPEFYRIWQETAHRQNFGVRGIDHLYQVWDHLIAGGHGILLLAEWEGEPLAGVIVIAFGSKAWYLYGGTRNLHRERMPMYLLQWEAIRWAKQRGCTLYDFLGVSCHMDPQDPLYGLYRFKRGFNHEYTEFIGEYDLPLQPRFHVLWNRLEPTYLRTMRGLGRARRRVDQLIGARSGTKDSEGS